MAGGEAFSVDSSFCANGVRIRRAFSNFRIAFASMFDDFDR